MFVLGLAEADAVLRWRRSVAIGAMLLLIADWPIVRGIDLLVPGITISAADLRELMDCCRAEGDSCVGFAPWHPIFCRDATELYLHWDFLTADAPEARATHQPYVEMWPTAVAAIENRPPRLIVDQEMWQNMHRERVITDEQYNRFLRVIKARYRPVRLGTVSAFVR